MCISEYTTGRSMRHAQVKISSVDAFKPHFVTNKRRRVYVMLNRLKILV